MDNITDKFDRPLRDLRISVTDRCNFRCPYCMPAEIYGERYEFIPRTKLLTFEEITELAQIFVELGVVKLRLTGGEPLVRSDLEVLVSNLTMIDGIDDLAMTTNGYLLPQKASLLKNAGLQRLTVSLDTLEDKVFRLMNGREFGVNKVLEGIAAAEQAGFSLIKINAVVQRGVNDHSVVELAKFFREKGHVVRFIEYMDVGNRNGWKLDDVVPADEILSMIDEEMPLEPIDSKYRGEVASRFRYRDGEGEVGVIASVTKPFCGDCTRLRLSPEGKLYTCLFAGTGTDLRDPMRQGASRKELMDIITKIWFGRQDKYSEDRTLMTNKIGDKVEMHVIGG